MRFIYTPLLNGKEMEDKLKKLLEQTAQVNKYEKKGQNGTGEKGDTESQ